MLVSTMLVTVNYDMHEPYDYAKLWELLRAEGLENRLLSVEGVWTKLPDSMWAAPLPAGDAAVMMEQVTLRLTQAAKAAGINVDLCVLVSQGWAWGVTEGTPPVPSPAMMLESLWGLGGPR